MQLIHLCCATLLLASLAWAYPVDNNQDEVHEPVPARDVPLEVSPEKQPEPAIPAKVQADEIHEPVYLKEGEKLAEVSDAKEVIESSEEGKSEEDKKEEISSEEDKKEEVAVAPEATFSLIDQDGDGFIDILEWERKLEDELAKKKFLDADANDDDKISQEEYNLWTAPSEPQENVNEVYAPSDLVVQPVDEPASPVGRSAEEGIDQGPDVVVVLDPVASAPEQSPVLPQEDAPAVIIEKVVVEEVNSQGQSEGEKVIAIVEEASEPAIVLLEDKKPEVVPDLLAAPALPATKSEEEVASAEEVKKEQDLPKPSEVSPAVEEVKPVKEESRAVEAQDQTEEKVKVQEPILVKSETLPEVAAPEVEKKPEVVEEKKQEQVSDEKKGEEVVLEEQKKPEVASEVSKPAEEEVKKSEEDLKKAEEELKKAEVSESELGKPSNLIRS